MFYYYFVEGISGVGMGRQGTATIPDLPPRLPGAWKGCEGQPHSWVPLPSHSPEEGESGLKGSGSCVFSYLSFLKR